MRLCYNLHKWNTCPIEINKAFPSVHLMYVFPCIFFKVNSCQTYFLCTPIIRYFNIAILTERKLILAYLVTLWKVGIKIVLSCKTTVRRNCAIRSKSCLYGVLNCLFIHYRQNTRHPGTYRTCLCIRL